MRVFSRSAGWRLLATVVLSLPPVFLACTSTPTASTGGGSGGGSNGNGGIGGSSGGGRSGTDIACWQPIGGSGGYNVVVGFAAPHDFSINTETNSFDAHTLTMDLPDLFAEKPSYTTVGSADHQHVVLFSAELYEELRALHTSTFRSLITEPPTGDPDGHIHTLRFTYCDLPGD